MLKDVVKLGPKVISDSGIPIKDTKSSLEFSWGTVYHPWVSAIDGYRFSILGIFMLPQLSTENDELEELPSNAAPKRTSTGTHASAVSEPGYSSAMTFQLVLEYWSTRVVLLESVAEPMIRSEA